ncbi:hypothetical protein [Roseibium aggregatum]|uniref:Uncharacterized protein n=1 Tax=Roseibium aggregatum TaxID=187304 RepID=A0A0M6Y7T0_9HYPH|nr:hypothetical protein [Roseibium aggregatum]CTQ45728.1 hypothetical protein LAL4801_04183 [Roseibium aggregatum]
MSLIVFPSNSDGLDRTPIGPPERTRKITETISRLIDAKVDLALSRENNNAMPFEFLRVTEVEKELDELLDGTTPC